MPHLTRQWLLPEPPPPQVEAALADFDPIRRSILYRRGVRDAASARTFLEPESGTGHDPLLLLGLESAAQRLLHACRRRDDVVVYGDYDADGLTASALLIRTLERLGARARVHVPNRFDEGYGLQVEALRQMREQGADLVVTVDCGIRSVEEAEQARALGLDLIITDHHHPGPSLPSALAVVSPKQPGDGYPFKELSGVGLALKLAQGLCRIAGVSEDEVPLELVALGTVADLVPLRGENRSLVAAGLRRLNSVGQPSAAGLPGLEALLDVAGLRRGRIDASAIAFALAPRLNAVGRLRSAEAAYRLLVTEDTREAGRLAQELQTANRERQELTTQVVAVARERGLTAHPLPALVFAADDGFHPGVVGLAAARLMEECYRPVVLAVRGETTTRGSARSIPEFHITQALDQCAHLLLRHGGHAAAAGFTLRTQDLDAFSARLRQVAAEELEGMELRPTLCLDAEVTLQDLDDELLDFLARIEPCGFGNPRPLLLLRGLTVADARAVGREGAHLKLVLAEGRRRMEAIAFRQAPLWPRLPQRIDVAAHLERNVYLGLETLQLNVVDLRPSGETD